MTTPKISAINGPSYLAKGFGLLWHPSLRAFVILPLLLNIILFVALSFYAVDQFSELQNWLMSYVPSWLQFLSWILWLLFSVLLLVMYGYTFSLVATLIASPFYGLLSEQAEVVLTGVKREEPLSFAVMMDIAKRSVIRELVKLGYFLPRLLAVFLLSLVLSFIPVLNLLSPIIVFLWGAWSLALQYTDYPSDNNGASFTQLRKQASGLKMSCYSFGGVALFVTSIPVVNLFAIPASVIGGTALWLEQLQHQDSLAK